MKKNEVGVTRHTYERKETDKYTNFRYKKLMERSHFEE
jgi:DNA-binding XRE family transcriptional regulator